MPRSQAAGSGVRRRLVRITSKIRGSQAASARSAQPSDAFEACLWKARRYLDERPQQAPLITINSWNEWTEGSYLEPDTASGMAYLEAIRDVFN